MNTTNKGRFIMRTAWNKIMEIEAPVYAVAAANDTGGWSDSPCPSDVATRELDALRAKLRKAGILTRTKVIQGGNFMVRRFVVVRPLDMETARAIVVESLDGTELLYSVR